MRRPFPIWLLFLLSVTIAPVSAQDSLVISEFMASNRSVLADEDGDYSDWIEIYNPAADTASLLGWYCTDDEELLTKWAFPDVRMGPGEYQVIFASGKDRKPSTGNLHTNFKLSSSGEFLAMVRPGGTTATTQFTPAFPPQYEDISYGEYQGGYSYYDTPTPGAENGISTFVHPPVFSVPHGFFTESFQLELSTVTGGARIYYTMDAGTPDVASGEWYQAPIPVSHTRVIRAVAVLEGRQSKTVTQTYIFPEEVIRQPMFPEGYPETWLQPINGTDDHIPIESDYGMHQFVVDNPTISPVIIDALQELPVVSIVSDIGNFFSESTDPDSGGIYMYTGAPDGPTVNMLYHLGHDWIRAGSAEFFNAGEGEPDFQVNCGIRLHGGATRTPWKTAKHSFRLGFKSEYGPSKLREDLFGDGTAGEYDWIILRGGFALRYGLQLLDPWMKSTYRDMGHYAAHSRFVHLYLNGMYWGLYNLCERMDASNLSNYLGGDAGDYDIMKDYYEVEAGDSVLWDQLVALSQDIYSHPENYQRMLGNNPDGTPNAAYEKLLDAVSLADYMLMNFYMGNTDWDHHNWIAARRRTDSEGFQFIPWDGEYILRDRNVNNVGTNNYNRPSGIFQALRQNEEFRNLLVGRINRNFFGNSALTPQPGLDRYRMWRAVIDTAIICESARWNSATEHKTDLWESSYHEFINYYFPVRTEIVFRQLIAAGFYPDIAAPVFNTANGYLEAGFELRLEAPDGGDILYTYDGSDPAYSGPAPTGSVHFYDGGVIPLISDTLTILARTKKDSLWSELTTGEFILEGDPHPISPAISRAGGIHLQAYPNPVHDELTIQYRLPGAMHVTLSLYTMTGVQLAILESSPVEAGLHSTTFSSSTLQPGTYLLVLDLPDVGERQRILLMVE